MAIVLDAFASYVADLLVQVAKDEAGMLLGVSGNINKLDGKLQDLKDYLSDAEKKRITDKHVERWVRKLKEVMYDATDILELCQLKAMERGASVDLGCFNPLLFCLRNPLFARDIASRIKKLNQRLDNIYETGAKFNFIKLEAYRDRRAAPPPASRTTSPVSEWFGVVGEKIEEDTLALVEVLTKEGETVRAVNNILVVAIVGVGGIGKTTLAKNIFNDETIQEKFDKTIWLSVTQNFNEAELLRTAIIATGGDHRVTLERSMLEPTLVYAIREKKFFVVLDDMWSERAWNDFLRTAFSHGAPGSRVLVTTRDERVARGMKAIHLHHVNKLGPDDAWSLLKKQFLQICRAPAIKRVGPEFLLCHRHRHPSHMGVAFPRLHKLIFSGMVEWEDWQWEEDVQGMPALEELVLQRCKLRSVPPGLASYARALRKLVVHDVQRLNSLENFTSIVELIVDENPDLESITNFPKLKKLDIMSCRKLEVLKGVPALWSHKLKDYNIETLPGYLQGVNIRNLQVDCSLRLLSSIALGDASPEWDKISHIQQVKAYASDGDNARRLYVSYRRDPYNFETNISDLHIQRGQE